ncbi:MAG TPA: formyltransferase family protein [Pseudomonadales bacterium]|nr:formyltransferase family protein [Pseudomonadales bacterium]
MRITLLANRDLHANFVVDRLVDALPEHEFSLVLSERVGRAADLPRELVELAQHERGLLTELVAPFTADRRPSPARPATRTFEQLAACLDAPPMVVNRPRSDSGRRVLADLAPALMISIRYGGILDAEHAASAPHGVLNLHSGRLPDYRGILASLRAALAGDEVLCCTLHRIVDSGIDTGPIIATADSPLDVERSLLWNIARLYEPGVALIEDAVRRIAAGDALPGTPQDLDAGAYFGLPDADTLAALRARGLRLVDLADSIELLRERYLPPGSEAPEGEHR